MSKLKIYSMGGSSVGDMEIADALLEGDSGYQAVHDVVVAHQARQRAGTASTLSKGEVAGSNKKPWRQKGTGRARAGYRQSPVWRGGGVAFGPHPRSFGGKINRKVAKLAFRRAFSDRIAEDAVRVLDEITLSEPKTRLLIDLIKSLKISGPVLFVVDKVDGNMAMAARNISGVEVVSAGNVNVYQLVRYPLIVVNRSGMDRIKVRLGGQGAEAPAGEPVAVTEDA